ncbi:MAG: hypothetical protein AAF726_11860 [Planctomycetota bacterium]
MTVVRTALLPAVLLVALGCGARTEDAAPDWAQDVIEEGEKDIEDDGVGKALARAYPDDLATGYTEGDVRGWFWVEVPSAR